MAEIPALSGSTTRKLAVQWDTLRDNQKLTDEDLSGYDRERQRLLRLPAKPPSHVRPLRPHEAARNIGLDASVGAAEGLFRQSAGEYWPLWCSSGAGYEVYREWLDWITRQVSTELASIWKGRSGVSDRWFQDTCAPALTKALAVLVKQRVAQAHDVEAKRLDLLPAGNPLLDEIRAGGDNLSPQAQEAIRLARAKGGKPEAARPMIEKPPQDALVRTEAEAATPITAIRYSTAEEAMAGAAQSIWQRYLRLKHAGKRWRPWRPMPIQSIIRWMSRTPRNSQRLPLGSDSMNSPTTNIGIGCRAAFRLRVFQSGLLNYIRRSEKHRWTSGARDQTSSGSGTKRLASRVWIARSMVECIGGRTARGPSKLFAVSRAIMAKR
jgi:hypothetical protein